MGRNQKNTVAYFPHYADYKSTLPILEQEFGVAGYAAWFKLLEELAKADGHFIDCSKPRKLRYLYAQLRLDQELGGDFLQTLTELEAIDRELWEEDKIIWVQNFVDNLASVYKNRKRDLPEKPVLTSRNNSSAGIPTSRNSSGDEFLPVESAQSKVKKRKEEKSKEEREEKEGFVAEKSATPTKIKSKTPAAKKTDFVDEVYELFREEFQLQREISYQGNLGKERSGIGGIIAKVRSDYCERNGREPPRGEMLDGLRILFRKALNVEEQFHWQKMSPTHLNSNYTEIKTLIQNPRKTKNGKSKGNINDLSRNLQRSREKFEQSRN